MSEHYRQPITVFGLILPIVVMGISHSSRADLHFVC